MKRCVPVVIAIVLAAGCTTVHRLDSTQFEVIPVPAGIQNSNTLQDVARRITNGIPVIFKVANGERMPFKLGMELPMGTLERADYTFAFNRDTYFLLSKKAGLQLSPDGKRWASITSPKRLAKLFGFNHGEFLFAFNSATNEKPFIKVEIKVK
jgi:hypothetical protein